MLPIIYLVVLISVCCVLCSDMDRDVMRKLICFVLICLFIYLASKEPMGAAGGVALLILMLIPNYMYGCYLHGKENKEIAEVLCIWGERR